MKHVVSVPGIREECYIFSVEDVIRMQNITVTPVSLDCENCLSTIYLLFSSISDVKYFILAYVVFLNKGGQ